MTFPNRPRYELRRVFEDGTETEPQVVSLAALPWDVTASRRGFCGAGLATSALILALRGDSPCDAAPNEKPRPIKAHKKAVSDLCFSADGEWLATASADRLAKVWSIPSVNLKRTLSHESAVLCVLFLPDGKTVVTGSGDRSLQLWQIEEGKNLVALSSSKASVRSLVAFPITSKLTFASADNDVRVWEKLPTKPLKILQGRGGIVFSMAVSPQDDRLLAAGGEDGVIYLWRTDLEEVPTLLERQGGMITKLAFTADGSRLISRSSDRSLNVWSVAEGRLLRTLRDQWSNVTTFVLARDDSAIVTAFHEEISVWSFPDGKRVGRLSGHRSDVQCLAASPDGKLLASGDRDGVVIVWNLKTMTVLSYLFDTESNGKESSGVTFDVAGASGGIITYTLPCGSPIPPGATCTCNCVPGRVGLSIPTPAVAESRAGEPKVRTPYVVPETPRYVPGPPIYIPRMYSTCTCNLVCTCIPVCQALHLKHVNSTIRQMAEQLLFTMGDTQLAYLSWAASVTTGRLRSRIHAITDRIRCGERVIQMSWPTPRDCVRLLESPNEIVSIMAAQSLIYGHPGLALPEEIAAQVEINLAWAYQRPWYVRLGVAASNVMT